MITTSLIKKVAFCAFIVRSICLFIVFIIRTVGYQVFTIHIAYLVSLWNARYSVAWYHFLDMNDMMGISEGSKQPQMTYTWCAISRHGIIGLLRVQR